MIGREEEVVAREAQTADLVILTHEPDLDSGDALHAAIFAVARPVLLVPRDWRGTTLSPIAIAWSGSDASQHAVAGALPWLQHADTVSVIRIGQDAAEMADLIDDLGLGGIKPDIRAVPRGAGELGEQIVAEAHAVGAGALVAGAYRHNVMVEWLLGGTTRHLLASADLPLFLAH